MDVEKISKVMDKFEQSFEDMDVRSEYVEQDLKLNAANDGRDALSKAVYSRLSDHLIAKINAALVTGGSEVSSTDQRIIGIVDIFGFEVTSPPFPQSPAPRPPPSSASSRGTQVFKFNSLEQLCINFANEKLHQQFIDYFFKLEIDEYEKEKLQARAARLDLEVGELRASQRASALEAAHSLKEAQLEKKASVTATPRQISIQIVR